MLAWLWGEVAADPAKQENSRIREKTKEKQNNAAGATQLKAQLAINFRNWKDSSQSILEKNSNEFTVALNVRFSRTNNLGTR